MLCLSTGVGDVVGSDATRLLSNVPMLNANWLAFTSRSVVGECSNIANSVNILKAINMSSYKLAILRAPTTNIPSIVIPHIIDCRHG